MLEIKNITTELNNKKVLNTITLTVKQGEIAVLLGPSGVGKSTLLRVLNNLEPYTSGTIVLDGVELDPAQATKKHLVGMVFQQFNLFTNMSVERNISFALERTGLLNSEQAHARAHELLAKYNLKDKAQVSVNRLSGGQKQRLALARTIAVQPRVLCLDEPTSALDPVLTASIAKNIIELAKQNYIVLIATHDISLVEQLPCTIYLMHEGSIIESARSQDFLANKQAYARIKQFVEGTA
jgi:ABC-type polar amino acid transport system ATPase subunit